jgi:hypothetical protein
MKTPLAVSAVILAACCVAATPDTWAERKSVTFEELQKGFAQPSMAYAPFAFWFWDAPLDPARASDEAERMLGQGFMPGYAHPRTGLPAEEWLSPKWFRTLDAALTKVEKATWAIATSTTGRAAAPAGGCSPSTPS